MTSAFCERAFSKLAHVKTKLRSTTVQHDHLDDLLLPYTEESMGNNVNVKDVIEGFKQLVPFNRHILF